MGVPERKKSKVNRFNRIAGQAQSIGKMIDEDRYCVDILMQIQAVKGALSRAESEVLKDHAGTCVSEAIASGDPIAQKEKFDELIDLLERSKR